MVAEYTDGPSSQDCVRKTHTAILVAHNMYILILLLMTSVFLVTKIFCEQDAFGSLIMWRDSEQFAKTHLWYHKRSDLPSELVLENYALKFEQIMMYRVVHYASNSRDALFTCALPSCPNAAYASPYRRCSHAACSGPCCGHQTSPHAHCRRRRATVIVSSVVIQVERRKDVRRCGSFPGPHATLPPG